jgi:hypothetical protein
MPETRLLVILATLALAAPAHADYADDAAGGLQIAKGAIDRTRRGIAIGPEVALHMTPIAQQRTPVLDAFVRGELGLGSEHPFVLALGVRATLDLL